MHVIFPRSSPAAWLPPRPHPLTPLCWLPRIYVLRHPFLSTLPLPFSRPLFPPPACLPSPLPYLFGLLYLLYSLCLAFFPPFFSYLLVLLPACLRVLLLLFLATCPSTHASSYLFTSILPQTYLSTHLLTYVSAYLSTYMSTYLSTYLSVYLFTYLAIYVLTYLCLTTQLQGYLFIYISTFQPDYIPACLPVCLPLFLPTYLHASMNTWTLTYFPLHFIPSLPLSLTLFIVPTYLLTLLPYLRVSLHTCLPACFSTQPATSLPPSITASPHAPVLKQLPAFFTFCFTCPASVTHLSRS